MTASQSSSPTNLRVAAILQFIVWTTRAPLCSSWFVPSSMVHNRKLGHRVVGESSCRCNSVSFVAPIPGHTRPSDSRLSVASTSTDGWRSKDNVNGADGADEDDEGGVDSNTEAWYDDLDVLAGGAEEEGLYGDDTPDDWIPDAEVARRRGPKSKHLIPAKDVLGPSKEGSDGSRTKSPPSGGTTTKDRPTPYTEEEEELITAMGGKDRNKMAASREEGFLGDSTLYEIATDYSVPICYLADVLAVWGVSVPINIHDRLGDLVTGEQAFALVEAVNSLDVGALQDRYSNQNLLQICDEWDIELKDAFGFAMKEGWSLPFGVRTNLRVEQEEELLRVYSPSYRDDDYDYDD